MEQAAGDSLKEYGLATLQFCCGPATFQKQVRISDIQDDVLIGMDIGENLDVISSQNKVIIDGINIPCTIIMEAIMYPVVAAVRYIISALSESIIDAYIRGSWD